MRKFLLVLCALAASLVLVGCTTPGPGEIGVTRNGGPYDNHRIRGCDNKPATSDCGIVKNGNSASWQGWGSSTHFYPVDSQQRFFRMATCYDDNKQPVPCKGADALAITVPTADGVDATIEGTFYLNTVFANSPAGYAAVKSFDTQFSTRTFGDDLHAYDGNDGWSSFLAAIVEPIVINNLRETIGGITCADLVSSCALVQNQGQAGAQEVAQKAHTGANQSNVSQVQDTVSKGLSQDLQNTLGHEYFQHIGFRVSRVLLPGRVQNAINAAQSSFAAVSQSQARVRSARLDAQANEERQRGYSRCATCARIDAIKALPRNLQALGSSVALGVK